MPPPQKKSIERSALHPRSRHRLGYDFDALVKFAPELAEFLRKNPAGDTTIDFAEPKAVLALNRALLFKDYGLRYWELPAGYLCPPIPGRADYVHALADLFAEGKGGKIPTGENVRVLDLGVGANCIYPIIGRREYGWSFVGTDIDGEALGAARRIVDANPLLKGGVDLRLQCNSLRLFEGVVRQGEHFSACVCNPPFHDSVESASAGSLRKMRNLAGRTLRRDATVRLNFGGKRTELICKGGELGFVTRLIVESARNPRLCDWFSCLISKSENLKHAQIALVREKVLEIRIIDMAQGQKKSRILAWRF